jgi:hypothetical protein
LVQTDLALGEGFLGLLPDFERLISGLNNDFLGFGLGIGGDIFSF